MEKKFKIISVFATLVLIGSVLICVVVMSQIMSKGYVSISGYSVFRVVTGSMEPTIPTGALLLSGPAEIEELEKGDIICFRSQSAQLLGQVITHRIIEIYTNEEGESYLETRGDANTVSDGYFVTEDNLVGEVVWYSGSENIFAKVVSGLSNRIGFFSFIVIPVLVFSAMLLKDSVKNIHKELEEYKVILEKEARKEAELATREAAEKAKDRNTSGIGEKTAEEILLEQMSAEEYQKLLESIKAEILEELTNSAGEEETGETATTE